MAESDERTTPQAEFEKLDAIFRFDLDAAAASANAKCAAFLTKEDDALAVDWSAWRSIFVNPPYSRGQLILWVAKAARDGTNVLMVLPGDTSTAWFHDAERLAALYFVRGRWKFNGNKSAAKFGTVLALFGRFTARQWRLLHAALPGFAHIASVKVR